MNDRERLRVLRATREFAGLNDAKLRSLLPYIDEVCVEAGSRVAEEGRLCHQFVIVASGFLETCRSGTSGKLGPGDTFGWESMRSRGVNDATLLAKGAAHLFLMSHEQFRAAEGLATPLLTRGARMHHAGAAGERSSQTNGDPHPVRPPSLSEL